MIKSKISGVNSVKSALKKEMKKLTNGDRFVLVGYPETLPSTEGGNSIAFVAAVNQFGTDTIPARPFLDVGIESVQEEIKAIAEDGVDEVIQGKSSMSNVLDKIGQIAVGGVQQTITDIRTPPNAPDTISKKGSSNPLIDTGLMRSSTTYVVTKEKPEDGI